MGLNRRPPRSRTTFEISDDLDADYDATGHFALRPPVAGPAVDARPDDDEPGAPQDGTRAAESGLAPAQPVAGPRLTLPALRTPRVEAVLALAACLGAVVAIVIAGRRPDAAPATTATTVVTAPARASDRPAARRRARPRSGTARRPARHRAPRQTPARARASRSPTPRPAATTSSDPAPRAAAPARAQSPAPALPRPARSQAEAEFGFERR